MRIQKSLFHASPIQGLSHIEPRQAKAYPDLGKVVFASLSSSFAACFGSYWGQDDGRVVTSHSVNSNFPREHTVNRITLEIFEPDNFDMDSPCSMYIIKGYFTYLDYNKGLEQYSTFPCGVEKEFKFKTFRDMLKNYNVEVKVLEHSYT